MLKEEDQVVKVPDTKVIQMEVMMEFISLNIMVSTFELTPHQYLLYDHSLKKVVIKLVIMPKQWRTQEMELDQQVPVSLTRDVKHGVKQDLLCSQKRRVCTF